MTAPLRFVVAITMIGILGMVAVQGVPEARASLADQQCVEVVTNGGFESGTAGWSAWSALGYDLVSDFKPHTGVYGAYLGGANNAQDVLSQMITLPADVTSLELSLWWSMTTDESAGSFDLMTVSLHESDGSVVAELLAVDNTAAVNVWDLATADLMPYAGQSLELTLAVTTDGSHPTAFFADDVGVRACSDGATSTPATPTATETPTSTSTPTGAATTTATPTGTATATSFPGVTPGSPTATLTVTTTSTSMPTALIPTATVDPASDGQRVSYLPCVLQ